MKDKHFNCSQTGFHCIKRIMIMEEKMGDRTFKDIEINLLDGSIEFCRDMIESDRKNIKRCEEEIEVYEKYLREDSPLLDKSHFENRLNSLKEKSKNYEILMKEKETKLARWEIQKFTKNNGKFKVIKGGADYEQ